MPTEEQDGSWNQRERAAKGQRAPSARSGKYPDHPLKKETHWSNPIAWTIQEGISAFPQARVALGVAAVAAAAALAVGFFESPLVAGAAVCVMLVLMVLLRLFSRAHVVGPGPSIVFTWFCLLLFMGVSVLLVSSVFFSEPRAFSELLNGGRIPDNPAPPVKHRDPDLPPNPGTQTKVVMPPAIAAAPDFLAAKEFNEGGTYAMLGGVASLNLGFCSAQQDCELSVDVAGQTAIPRARYGANDPIAFRFNSMDYLLKLGMIGDSSAFVSAFPATMPTGRPPSPQFVAPSNFLEGRTHVFLGGRVAINLGDCQAQSSCQLSIDVDGQAVVSPKRYGSGSPIPFKFRGRGYVLKLGQIGDSDVALSVYPAP